jgi:hypothetical protein
VSNVLTRIWGRVYLLVFKGISGYNEKRYRFYDNMMNFLKNSWLLVLMIAVFAGVFAFKQFHRLPPPAEPSEVSWRSDFGDDEISSLPEGWKLRGKPGTPTAKFSIEKQENKGTHILSMEADSASGTLITLAKGVDLEKTPFLSWRWRVREFPKGADGRTAKTDDQAIGIYAGDGSLLNSKSVSYRWDTDTPRGAEGKCSYVGGAVKVKWFTLRNREDGVGQWFYESRNLLEDFKKAWGTVPKKLYISVSSNSQYTGTTAAADLEWVEISSSPEGK